MFDDLRSATVLQSSMQSSLQKKSGSNYGPPASSKMIFFVDDLNLPALDAYNTQSAIALIRQHIDYGHWYLISRELCAWNTPQTYVTG